MSDYVREDKLISADKRIVELERILRKTAEVARKAYIELDLTEQEVKDFQEGYKAVYGIPFSND